MKFANLLSFLPLVSATSIKPRTDYTPVPATSAECCPFTYKQTCTKNLERMYHIQLFYNRKKGLSSEDFNAYWANNHTKTAGDFHLRMGVYKYSQVCHPLAPSHSSLTDVCSIIQLPSLET